MLGKRTRCEEEARHVACSEVESSSADRETNDGKTHHDGDVPGSIVVFPGGDANADTDRARNQGRWSR